MEPLILLLIVTAAFIAFLIACAQTGSTKKFGTTGHTTTEFKAFLIFAGSAILALWLGYTIPLQVDDGVRMLVDPFYSNVWWGWTLATSVYMICRAIVKLKR